MRPPTILIIEHDRRRPPGALGDLLARHRLATFKLLIRRADDFPAAHTLENFAAVVLLDAARPPAPQWQAAAEDFARAVHASERPTLAFGYGAELMTGAAGGKVVAAAPTLGWFPFERGSATHAYTASAPAETRVLAWHAARLEPPPGACVLGRDQGRRVLAWRDRCHLALHHLPQFDRRDYHGCLQQWRNRPVAPSAWVQTLAELEHADTAWLPANCAASRQLVQGWLAEHGLDRDQKSHPQASCAPT